jgi:DNA-binding CsgD family transcriptional regulator
VVDSDRSVGGVSIVGRALELERLDEFVCTPIGGGTLVLVGGPGIGKTTLWEASVQSARTTGVRVLAARSPMVGEAQLPFMGLLDLCDGIAPTELAVLSAPQRRALETALLRVAPSGAPTSAALIAVGLLGVVQALAARDPVLIAIDDLQWLDPASADALVFLARRIGGARIGFLLSRRDGRAGALETMLSRGQFERVRLGPLSLGAVRRLLFERLGLAMSRQHVRRIVEATGGNPLFALEVGRSLQERTGSGLGLRFDSARCLLALGRAQRRFKQWRDARETLEQAIAAFAALGAERWAERARSELARVGGRRRAGGKLTPSERRVVELATQGLSNKQIALKLFVTVNTVEVHLSRAYMKLGVHSRAQLAERLAGDA